jgi:hypothetical protein
MRLCGARIRFVDIRLDTLNMDENLIDAAVIENIEMRSIKDGEGKQVRDVARRAFRGYYGQISRRQNVWSRVGFEPTRAYYTFHKWFKG